ncbi:hypothetical protein F0562_013718 [Nyssa sinensis]|uniref:Uncharacterized protein n=1 Tax=Nyssa sinensis TaxID=561372 RepID=A0A5J4ZPQ0_9ASTE|nr:hypothetical protein F0562_013718 [Nyssa sinensis]
MAVLRDHGVPESRISLFLKSQPNAFMRIPEQFRGIVEEVKEMGFDPSKWNFLYAIRGLTGFSKSTRERKSEVYRTWGWSADEIILAFKKTPACMAISEKKINKVMDFLINKMGWTASDVARCPAAFCSSLENWTIPRCLVVQLLLSKSLIKKDFSLTTVIASKEKEFLNKFVTKYQINFPELLNLYERKSVGLATPSQGLDALIVAFDLAVGSFDRRVRSLGWKLSSPPFSLISRLSAISRLEALIVTFDLISYGRVGIASLPLFPKKQKKKEEEKINFN